MRPVVVRPNVTPASLEEEVEIFLVRPNLALLQKRHYPPLLTSHVRYRREPLGRESWRPVDVLYQEGEGDCEDLSGTLTAQLRRAGRRARVRVKKTGARLWHAVVEVEERAGITIIDPSKLLGM